MDIHCYRDFDLHGIAARWLDKPPAAHTYAFAMRFCSNRPHGFEARQSARIGPISGKERVVDT